jgi:hypothetical protein
MHAAQLQAPFGAEQGFPAGANSDFQGGNVLSECIDWAHDRPQYQFLHGRQARQRQQRLATAGRGEGGAVLSGV